MSKVKTLAEYGVSQSMLAFEMGVPRQLVSRWFTGTTLPSARSTIKISDALTKLTGESVSPAQVYLMLNDIVKSKEQAQ
jgi:predicted transcriptional regulator